MSTLWVMVEHRSTTYEWIWFAVSDSVEYREGTIVMVLWADSRMCVRIEHKLRTFGIMG